MSNRLTGHLAVAKLEEIVSSHKKRGFLYRIEDASDLHGLNKRIVNTTPKPCDHIVVLDGRTFWCEAKETANTKGFPIKNISTEQWLYARIIEAAGGTYCFFIYAVETGRVYLVPAHWLAEMAGTVPWNLFQPWVWNEDETCPRAIAA